MNAGFDRRRDYLYFLASVLSYHVSVERVWNHSDRLATVSQWIERSVSEKGAVSVPWRLWEKAAYPSYAPKKGPIYLVDIKGRVHQGVCAPFFTNRVIMLQDYDHIVARIVELKLRGQSYSLESKLSISHTSEISSVTLQTILRPSELTLQCLTTPGKVTRILEVPPSVGTLMTSDFGKPGLKII
jgi:hypothetical protein